MRQAIAKRSEKTSWWRDSEKERKMGDRGSESVAIEKNREEWYGGGSGGIALLFNHTLLTSAAA